MNAQNVECNFESFGPQFHGGLKHSVWTTSVRTCLKSWINLHHRKQSGLVEIPKAEVLPYLPVQSWFSLANGSVGQCSITTQCGICCIHKKYVIGVWQTRSRRFFGHRRFTIDQHSTFLSSWKYGLQFICWKYQSYFCLKFSNSILFFWSAWYFSLQ